MGFCIGSEAEVSRGHIKERLRKEGVSLETLVELISIDVEEAMPKDGYRITAVTKDGVTGAKSIVKCKYLIGAGHLSDVLWKCGSMEVHQTISGCESTG